MKLASFLLPILTKRIGSAMFRLLPLPAARRKSLLLLSDHVPAMVPMRGFSLRNQFQQQLPAGLAQPF